MTDFNNNNMNIVEQDELSNIVSNCPLCEAHGLHVMGEADAQIMQCLNCGYTSTSTYFGTKQKCKAFQKLPDDIKEWSIEKDSKIWLPVQITLPIGMLCPSKVDDKMRWTFFEMIEIKPEEREKYPDGNGSYYSRRYDMENPKLYDTFLEAMSELNQRLKDEVKNVDEKMVDDLMGISLPKLKRIDNDSKNS